MLEEKRLRTKIQILEKPEAFLEHYKMYKIYKEAIKLSCMKIPVVQECECLTGNFIYFLFERQNFPYRIQNVLGFKLLLPLAGDGAGAPSYTLW